MHNKKAAKKIVKDLEPEDGWWKSSTEDSLIKIADDLLFYGLSSETISDTLDEIISIMREEYGE